MREPLGIGHRTGLAAALLCAAMALVPLTGCGVPSPDGPADTYGLDFSLPKDAKVRGAIIFLIDGLNADIFQQMLDAGELPAFKKYLVDRGTYAPRAIASTPTVTLANLTSVVTGQFPGHTDITGINWFDRNRLVWRDYATIAQKNTLDGDYIAPNIYEQFPDETTWSIFYQPHRGATKFAEDRMSAGPPYFFGWYEFVDRITLWRFHLLADIARKQERFPAVTTVYLLATDFMAYRHGPDSPEYREALRHSDRQIGRVLGDLQRAGLLEGLHIALVSDHGHIPVAQHFHMNQFCEKDLGLVLDSGHWWEHDPFEERLADYNKVTAVAYGSGDRFYALCLRAPKRDDGKIIGWEPWIVRPSPRDLKDYPTVKPGEAFAPPVRMRVNLVEAMLKQPAVDVVAHSCGPNRVRVLRRGGEVEFQQDGGREAGIVHKLISGDDPLEWKGKVPAEMLAGRPATSRQWLDATADTGYPDLPAQILAYFRSRHAGDIAAFATPGWDFNHNNKSGHGGVSPGDMHVPLLIAGPNVPHQRLDVARSVDLMPTLLMLLGRPMPDNLDGRSLVSKPSSAVQSQP